MEIFKIKIMKTLRIKMVAVFVLHRVLWFLMGRLGRKLWIKRSLRLWWVIFWWGLLGMLIMGYVVIPFFRILFMLTEGFNYVILGY